jgi:tetratricopeptide (TPR) repeat protein
MFKYILAVLLAVILLTAGCSQSLYMKGKMASRDGDDETALTTLYQAVQENPNDHRPWREIGTIYFKNNSLEKAEEAFGMSNRIRPNAPSSLYLGLIFEGRKEFGKAIKLYGSAINLESDSRTKERIRERLNFLIDKKLEQDAMMAVRDESDIDVQSIPQNTIAVINFDGSALQPDMTPLALGLAELTAIDLAKVSKLNVIERIKINTILEELEFSQSKYADPTLAPRVGRLLGSRKLVLGTITGTGEEAFRIDGATVNSVNGKTSRTKAMEGKLDKFFQVQKDFVFGVIDSLGIELTKAERDAIEEVPTESFLAFMAFSRGLQYQQEGMPEKALESFRRAKQLDPGFNSAAGKASNMEHNLSWSRDKNNEKLEKLIDTSVRMGEMEIGLDNIQTANIFNNGFIRPVDTRFDFGTDPLAPPGGGAISTGYGFIIIEGNLDAD